MTISFDEQKTTFQKRWIEYLNILGNLEGKIHYQYIVDGHKYTDFKEDIVYSYPFISGRRYSTNGDVAMVTGKSYSFVLSNDKSDAPWRIESLYPNSEIPDIKSWCFPKHFSVENEKIGYKIFNTLGSCLFADQSRPNLPDIFRGTLLKIRRLEYIGNKEKKQILLDFDYVITYDDIEKNYQQLLDRKDYRFTLHGEVVLETDYFLITKGKFQAGDFVETRDTEVEFEYDYSVNHIPLPKKYKAVSHVVRTDSDFDGIAEINIEYDLRETSPKDTERFTLTAFGLPELVSTSNRFSRIRFLLLLFGGILIFIGLWQMCKKRKDQSK